LIVSGGDVREEIEASNFASAQLHRPLARLGVRRGDAFGVSRSEQTAHYFYDWTPDFDVAGECAGGAEARVVVVGCGAIGSNLVVHAGRLGGVASVLTVDPDTYSADNLGGQAIFRHEVGKPKAHVQARRLKAINPELRVSAIRGRIEDVPLALLAGAVVAACVDSRAARQAINEAVWLVGRCWIDAAVDGPELLARVIAYRPDETSACMECAWDDGDYAALEQVYPCEALRSEADPATEGEE
jgi:molybdopterin/thiamine biosynthesis adenylyltransferase